MCANFNDNLSTWWLKNWDAVEKNYHLLNMGFPIHFATCVRSTPHGIVHKTSTVMSREVVEPILETRKIGLQHMLKTKKLKILTEEKKIPVFKALDQADQKYRQAVPYNDCACT